MVVKPHVVNISKESMQSSSQGFIRGIFSKKLTRLGIASVTLQGEKRDWETLLEKCHKFLELGTLATSEWRYLLVPVLKRFVDTFDNLTENEEFWGQILHHHRNGSGQPHHFSGWLNVFSYWDEKGACLNTRDLKFWKEPI